MDIKQLLASISPVLGFTYNKRLTVYNSEPYTKENGADGIKFVTVARDIPCRLSRDARQNIYLDDMAKNQNSNILFTVPDVEIKPGSKLEIDGTKYSMTDEPMVYSSHQEVKVRKDEWI